MNIGDYLIKVANLLRRDGQLRRQVTGKGEDMAVYSKQLVNEYGSGYGWAYLVVSRTEDTALYVMVDLVEEYGRVGSVWDQRQYSYVVADPNNYDPGEGWKRES